MTRLLVLTPEDRHEIIEVAEGGCYFDSSRVIWDESISGQIPIDMEEMVVEEQAAIAKVPAAVPMLNAHLALIEAGWMPTVRFFLEKMAGIEGEQARAYFDKAQTCRRDHPLVSSLCARMGKTKEQIDAIFVRASVIA